MEKYLVGILMGSDSDLAVMQQAGEVLKEMGVAYEIDISSAHRLPDKTAQYARSARERGVDVLICGAGMAAHLAGVVASHTTLPVIGVPLASGALNGVDALYATVQMPPIWPAPSSPSNTRKLLSGWTNFARNHGAAYWKNLPR